MPAPYLVLNGPPSETMRYYGEIGSWWISFDGETYVLVPLPCSGTGTLPDVVKPATSWGTLTLPADGSWAALGHSRNVLEWIVPHNGMTERRGPVQYNRRVLGVIWLVHQGTAHTGI